MAKLYNYEVEKLFLAGMMKHRGVFDEIQNILKVEHFYDENPLHSVIFRVLSQKLERGQDVDEMLISQEINALQMKFENIDNIYEYLRQLKAKKVTEGGALEAARVMMVNFVRREITNGCDKIKSKMLKMEFKTYSEIIEASDEIYNNKISYFDQGTEDLENIFEDIEDVVEATVDQDGTFLGPKGPHKLMYQMYGSFVRPGNIGMLVARAGCGKTTFALDYATEAMFETNCAVIHFDNGEMSKKELQLRMVARLSGVSLHAIESGKWRRMNEETVKKVREIYKKVKGFKFFYKNVGGSSADEIKTMLKRGYYSKVGRGEYCIFSFDYLKTSGEGDNRKQEYQFVGDVMDNFKQVIQRDIVDEDGEPLIGMISSVQANRLGIVGQKNSSEIVEDESVISLSDRIIQIVSHMYILRKKSTSEIAWCGEEFGTHYLTNIKARHMGEDIGRAFTPVEIDGKLMQNKINLSVDNFFVTEVGDMHSVAEKFKVTAAAEDSSPKNEELGILGK